MARQSSMMRSGKQWSGACIKALGTAEYTIPIALKPSAEKWLA
ncbi:hypothetical protein [Myxosarcina sp. GI1]|nr:hypothetical protein [Myxosarcina sp. GI1]